MSILMHALPMPLEGEQHSVGHPDRTEHAPTGQQPNLAGRKSFLVSVHNVAVVQDEAMHVLILAEADNRIGVS
jgi:hypothetical protein